MSAGDDLLDRFVAFSETATGFSAVDLHGTGQAATYLATVRQQAGDGIVRELLEGSEPGPPGGEVFGDAKLGPLARNIIKLWYSGVWYQLPPEWAARYGAPVQGVPAQRLPGERRTPEHGAAGHALAATTGPLEQQGRQRTPARIASFVVCPAAYTEGLLWRAIGAHPAGAKAPGYGSWAAPPVIEGYSSGDVKGGSQ
jgi:hypothetical protein